MKGRVLSLYLVLLAGCSVGTVPDQALTPSATPASVEAAPTPLPQQPQPILPRYDNIKANPMPTGAIEPVVPFTGDEATVHAAGLPPDSDFELWLVPRQIIFRFGLPQPKQLDGVKLGNAHSDRAGQLTYTFEMKEGYPTNNGTERGKLGLWLVYPDGKTLAPDFVAWGAGNPTTFNGRVYDESGKPCPVGTKVKITVVGGTSEKQVTYYEGEAEVVNGEYRFERVPAPAGTTIEAVLPSGVSRKRSAYNMLAQWGCCNGDDYGYGKPLTYNFGGPATAVDPLAPAFFLSEHLADPEFVWTAVNGHVYDQLGNLVPDTAQAIVLIDGTQLPGEEPYHVKIPVRDGAYEAKVPIGLVNFDLRVEPGVHVLIRPRMQTIVLPEQLVGHPTVVNFGGPATEEDPNAPYFAFPSPQPVFTGPSPF